MRSWSTKQSVSLYVYTAALIIMRAPPLSTLLLAAACSPLSAYAGMYGDPVINLDAKSLKKAMATEHAAVGPYFS